MELDSMYAYYVKEKYGCDIICDEWGFVEYKCMEDKETIFVRNLFVHPDHRRKKIATSFRKCMIEKIGEDIYKYVRVVTQCDTSTNGWEKSKAFLESINFKPYKTVGKVINFARPVFIEGEQ